MKTSLRSVLFLLALATASLGGTRLIAEETKPAAGQLVRADKTTDATWLAKAIAAYPLDSCIVSDDKFDGGDMGVPMDYIYKVAGQPDRLVRLCCKDCVKDFTKKPAKFLKMIDEAVAAKAKSGK